MCQNSLKQGTPGIWKVGPALCSSSDVYSGLKWMHKYLQELHAVAKLQFPALGASSTYSGGGLRRTYVYLQGVHLVLVFSLLISIVGWSRDTETCVMSSDLSLTSHWPLTVGLLFGGAAPLRTEEVRQHASSPMCKVVFWPTPECTLVHLSAPDKSVQKRWLVF